ncbi:MAG: hypothetical protein GF411_18560 [Candidatus Lokiarchaeota archaeon]|nr:hypothetical protein [Candidatus Lokiarchaeota archaeon]
MKIEDIEAREKYKRFLAPHYRQIELAAAPNMPFFSDIRDDVYQEQIRRAANPTPVWFEIRFPVGQLEVIRKTTLTKHIKIKYKRTYSDSVIAPMAVHAVFTKLKAKGILSAIRSRLHNFALQQYIALKFEMGVSNLLSATRELVLAKLETIDPTLLTMFNDSISKHERSTEGLHLMQIMEDLRTIVRQFTSVMLLEEMHSSDDEPLSLHVVGTKIGSLLNWVKEQAVTKLGRELKSERTHIKRVGKLLMD